MIEQDNKQIESAVLVGIINRDQDENQVREYLDELEFLAFTAGIETKKRFTQRLAQAHGGHFIGSGKLQEIKQYVEEHEISGVIFDDELSPSQQRNLEKELEVRILDRTSLILDIFGQRARTAHAKTQVELALYQYMLPRLKGMWTHLERQRGGTGTRGGAGEKEIETDSRIVRYRITLLKDKLKEIDKQMATQRKSRGEMVRLSLVGYTNVGKSTLMNLLSKSEVFAENKLFATLDTTVRKVVIYNLPFLLSDTVGFIRKLPTQLVESFKSTLDEVREADILLHVVDISHPNFEEQIETVNKIITEIGAGDKEMIMVFNKIDAYQAAERDEHDLGPIEKKHFSLDEWKRTWMAKTSGKCVFISATEKANIDSLREIIYRTAGSLHADRYPENNFLF